MFFYCGLRWILECIVIRPTSVYLLSVLWVFGTSLWDLDIKLREYGLPFILTLCADRFGLH